MISESDEGGEPVNAMEGDGTLPTANGGDDGAGLPGDDDVLPGDDDVLPGDDDVLPGDDEDFIIVSEKIT